MILKPYLEEKEVVFSETGSSMAGLTDAEAAERLAQNGPNRLKEGKKDSLLVKFLGELKDPMTLVLIVAAAVSAVTALYAGESLTDAVIILAVVLINACLGVYQESKAEAAIEALQQVAAATAKVIRGDPGGRRRRTRRRPHRGVRLHEDPGGRPDRRVHRRGEAERGSGRGGQRGCVAG